MKNLLIAFVLMFGLSQLAMANSADSKVTNKRHIQLVLNTLAEACQLDDFGMTELSTMVTELKIDNGIIDYAYQSQFKVFNREDGRHNEEFLIEIDTNYTHAYDHDAKDWGIYSVSRVGICQPVIQ